MSEYVNMEKVGSIGANLPANDEQTTTQAGDLIAGSVDDFIQFFLFKCHINPNSFK